MNSTGVSGGCFCGLIRYSATSVFDAGYCHCSVCRCFSGAPAACWFSVREELFSVTAGCPKSFRSSAHFMRYFCSECGTHLYGRDDLPVPPKVGSRLVSVMLGTLDAPDALVPTLHQWWQNRMPWYGDALTLPTFETGTITHPLERMPRDG